jgi:hypothetical protein
MKRLQRAILTALAVGAVATVTATSVHLKGGANAEPVFNDLGLSLRAAGALAGLGAGDVLVSLSAQADVDSTCTNQGGAKAPGQNPAPLTVTGSQPISEEELKNGTTPFDVVTAAPVTPIAGAPGCPNSNWTEDINDLSFTSATLTVEQPVGTLVLTVNCAFNPKTSNGAVSGADVTCTSN